MGEVQLIQAGPVRLAYRESGPASHVNRDRLAQMAGLIPGARLIMLPAGHLVHARQPEAFISAVADFLAEDQNR